MHRFFLWFCHSDHGTTGGLQADRPELYDAIAPAGREMQEKVIETLGNLEKLTAPTTWVSPQKEVPLEHLAVLPETRVPWKGTFMRPNRVFQSQKSISPEAQERLRKFAMTSGSQVEFDSSGITKLVIPGRAVKSGALDVFSGSAVANATHPVEAEARRAGGTGLEEEKSYVPMP